MSQIIEHTLRLISRRHIRMMVFGMGLGGLVGCTCLSARPEEVVGNIAVLVVESFVAVWVLVKADSLMHSLISSQLGSLRSRLSAARDRLESTIGNTPSPRPDQARPSVLQRLDQQPVALQYKPRRTGHHLGRSQRRPGRLSSHLEEVRAIVNLLRAEQTAGQGSHHHDRRTLCVS